MLHIVGTRKKNRQVILFIRQIKLARKRQRFLQHFGIISGFNSDIIYQQLGKIKPGHNIILHI